MTCLEKLSTLLDAPYKLHGGINSSDLSASGVSSDSRALDSDTVFVAIVGAESDGHQYLPSAILKSQIIVVESLANLPSSYSGVSFCVSSTRVALAKMANYFYSPKISELKLVGITGTNGKTSTSYLTEQILSRMGEKVGLIGTLGHRLGEQTWETDFTTPQPVELHRRLQQMKDLNADFVAMEVSSHALHQERVGALNFSVAVFTNLSLDHLDYHRTMEEYFQSKVKLFTERLDKTNGISVVNTDDSWGKKLASLCQNQNMITFGQEESSRVRFKVISHGASGAQLEVYYEGEKFIVNTELAGLYNMYNLIGAMISVAHLGFLFSEIVKVVSGLPSIPGRLDRVSNSSGFNIFVDYAHTPDALSKTLQALVDLRAKEKSRSRIISVFGCGGDRDKSKRPIMLQAAQDHADLIFVTSDNPRTEDPEQIISDIVQGEMVDNKKLFIEVDRKLAIGKAVRLLQSGDFLLVAGKGHEDYQIIGTEKKPFCDKSTVKEALDAL